MGKETATAKQESCNGKRQNTQYPHDKDKTYQNPTNANYSTEPYNQKTLYIIDTIPTTDTPAILDPQQRIYQSSIGEIGEFIPEKPIKYIEPTTTIGTKTIGDLTNIPDSWLKPTE